MANRHANFRTSQGDFRLELFEDKAPITPGNFIKLAEAGFYNRLVFHRIISGFMIQGGCPQGTGRGGPGYNIEDEFHPELQHDGPGVLSMANSGPNTGGSQFFIALVPTDWLNNHHAVFGKVVEGIEVVNAIGAVQTGAQDRPVEDVIVEEGTIV